MIYILLLVLSILSSSWDKWLGENLFFSFPVFALYILNININKNKKFFFGLIYVLFYFSSRYSLGLFALIFYLIFLFLIEVLNDLDSSLITCMFFSLPLIIALSFINVSIISFIVTSSLILLFYFLNIKWVFYEK